MADLQLPPALAPDGRTNSDIAQGDIPLDVDGEDFRSQLETPDSGGAEDLIFYLQLQRRVMAEQRFFSTFSNVIKARHESASNSIRNMRS